MSWIISSVYSIRCELYYHMPWGLLSWWSCWVLQTQL